MERHRKSRGSLWMLCVIPTLIQGLDIPLHSTVHPEEKAEVQLIVNSCKQNLSLLNCKLVLTSISYSQRTEFNDTFLLISCTTDMLLLGPVLSVFIKCSYVFLFITFMVRLLNQAKGYPSSISQFNFAPKVIKSSHNTCRYHLSHLSSRQPICFYSRGDLHPSYWVCQGRKINPNPTTLKINFMKKNTWLACTVLWIPLGPCWWVWDHFLPWTLITLV